VASRTGSGRQQPAGDLSELERRRLWLSAQHAVRDAAEQIRHASAPRASTAERATAQAAATAASEMLHIVSTLVEGKRDGPLPAGADSHDRAARDLHCRTVRPTGSSRSLRDAARALSAVRIVKRGETRHLLALLMQLAALSQSVGELRHVQARAAQAGAARLAAEQLLAEHGRRAAHAAAAVAPVQQAASPGPREAATRPAAGDREGRARPVASARAAAQRGESAVGGRRPARAGGGRPRTREHPGDVTDVPTRHDPTVESGAEPMDLLYGRSEPVTG
jgi:hypothetical protein